MTTRTTTTAMASSVSPHLTQAGSCCAFRTMVKAALLGFSRTASAFIVQAPTFQQIDQHQHEERNDQQDDGDRRRFSVSELFESRDDQDRSDLRSVRHVPGYEDHRSILAHATGECQGKAGD